MLSRDQFELGCHTFASRHPQWSWVPGDRPGYGFLTRTRHLRWKLPFDPYSHVDSVDLEEVEVEEEDIATVQASELPSLTGHDYIVYSASFNVPAFYFTMQNSSA
jgi:ubiquitin-like-conjugating enzyme ATG10